MNDPPLTDREYAYLHVSGPGSHEDITKVLRFRPSEAWNVGDTNPRNGKPFRKMAWILKSDLDDTRGVREHIEALLLLLGARSEELRSMWLDYDLTLSCVGHYPRWNHGMTFDRELLRQVASLGLAMDFDFYYVTERERDEPEE